LKGSIEVRLGNETRALSQGESLYFNASVPHSFRNKLKSESQLLSIVTPVSL
jgi:quercetin dioxygenase-like cupin family protein